ncbi:MAG: hypothetical protein DHS20C11_07820 [Lysobacteraceae bacterium]|nr:MAG: hypothetical protein DHS20C11_07820 [Xanthomonadaceae bacterium]
MKLVFPNGDHQAVILSPGKLVVGSAAECDLRLTANGVGLKHAVLDVSDNTAVLSVANPDNVTKVNHKVVTGTAQVKAGDLLSFSAVECRFVSVETAATAAPSPAAPAPSTGDEGHTVVRQAIPKFMLRGVSGATFGKIFPLKPKTTLGRHSDCDIHVPGNEVSRHHASIVVGANTLVVEDMGSANGTYINGKRVKQRQNIKPGDELRIDQVRFMVLTPGMEAQAVKKAATPAPEAAAPAGMAPAVKYALIGTGVLVLVVVGLFMAGVI